MQLFSQQGPRWLLTLGVLNFFFLRNVKSVIFSQFHSCCIWLDWKYFFMGCVLYSKSHDISWWRHQMALLAFVRGIHQSPVNSPHKGQWRGALIFSLICVWLNGWVNNREAGDLRRYRAHNYVIVMSWWRHDVETISTLLILCEGNSIHKRPGNALLWCFLWCWPKQTV